MTGDQAAISTKASEAVLRGASPNPYVFVVGCPRSGTTLLLRILDAHPHIAMVPEAAWMLCYFFRKREGVTPDGVGTPELVPNLLEDERFSPVNLGRTELERLLHSSEPVSYPSFITGIFDLYANAQGKPLAGNKTPGYVRRLGTLHTLFPKVRFVHLIRDGRDLCLSFLKWRRAERTGGKFATWSQDRVSTTALWWELQVRLGQETGRLLGPELYHEIRYESLVTHPADECAALCDFLGVPYDDWMLHFHEGRSRFEPGLSAKHAWLPVTPGLRDWRTQMTAVDVERFEVACGDLLDELGYPRAVPDPGAQAREQASKIRHLFIQDLQARGKNLPERWPALRSGRT